MTYAGAPGAEYRKALANLSLRVDGTAGLDKAEGLRKPFPS
jgi:hypothetical protein